MDIENYLVKGTDSLQKQLDSALDYALETGNFHKQNIIEQADAVCVFGLGTYFEEAFFQAE